MPRRGLALVVRVRDPQSTSFNAGALFKNTIWQLSSTVVVLLANLLASILVARYLGPDLFGVYALIVWVRVTSAMLLDVGFSSAITKFVAELSGARYRAEAESLARMLIVGQIAVAAFGAIMLWLVAAPLATALNQPEAAPLIPLAIAALGFNVVGGAFLGRLAGLQRFMLKAALETIGAVATIVGTVAVIAIGGGIREFLWLDIAVAALVALLTITRSQMRPLGGGPLDRQLLGRVARFCFGIFLVTSFDAILWQRSETFVLGRVNGVDQVAYFGAAYFLAVLPVTLVPHALGATLAPFLSHRLGTSGVGAVRQSYMISTKYSALVALPICFLGAGLAEAVIRATYGNAYAAAAPALRLLLIGAAAGALATPGTSLFLALGIPARRAFWGLPLAGVDLLLTVLLVPALGSTGAAFAKCVSQLSHVSIEAQYLRRKQHVTFPLGSLIRIAIASGAAGLVAYVVSSTLPVVEGLILGGLVGIIVYGLGLILLSAFDSVDFDVMLEILQAAPSQFAERAIPALARMRQLCLR